jgi:hypothetical protein
MALCFSVLLSLLINLNRYCYLNDRQLKDPEVHLVSKAGNHLSPQLKYKENSFSDPYPPWKAKVGYLL